MSKRPKVSTWRKSISATAPLRKESVKKIRKGHEQETPVSGSNGIQRLFQNRSFKIAITFSGWVAALLMGVLNLPAAINSFTKELPTAAETTGLWQPIDKRFSGAWGMASACKTDPLEVGDMTEGNLMEDEPPAGHGLDLTLTFEGDRVSGEIISDGLRKNYVFPEVEMLGLASGARARMRVFDWVGGKATTLANIEITRLSGDCLKFATIDGSANLFPQTAFMKRQSDDEYNRISRGGGMMDKLLEKILKEAHDKRKR